MTTEMQEIATSLWMSDRDADSLHLAKEVDGDRTTGDQIRRAFGDYFAVIGDVSDITTYPQAEVWAQNLRAEGRFPVPILSNWREGEHQVVSRLYRPHLLGFAALADDYIKNTSPMLFEVASVYRKQLRTRVAATDVAFDLDAAAKGCINDKRLDREYSRVMSGFSSAAISDYLDMRSQEDGFVTAMQDAAERRRQALSEGFPSFPVERRPWEVAK